MVSDAETEENRFACYDVLQAHAKIIAEKEYSVQFAAHIKKGRKAKTFKFTSTELLNTLIQMSKE